MKRLVLASLVIASTLRADTQMLSTSQLQVLTPIDQVPTQTSIERAFEGSPTPIDQQLAAIALSTDPGLDFGVQLRAVRALSYYCPVAASCAGTTPHAALQQIVQDYQAIPGAPTPRDTMRLRAAIEGLGIAGRSAGLTLDEQLLAHYLDNTSRDIRAAAAKALAVLCNGDAIDALKTRSAAEHDFQVTLAISAALRDLSDCLAGH